MQSPDSTISQLRREWLFMTLFFSALLCAGGLALASTMTGAVLTVWGMTAGLLMMYQLAHLRIHLRDNIPLEGGGETYASLGTANWVTMGRASLLALLAGFAFSTRPSGWEAWLPGALYITAALLDFLDGYLARITHRASRLGEILDMHWDGFGVLVASWLLVRYGQTQGWFLIIGLARYLFLAGMKVRDWLGRENYPLPPSMIRRAMAGAQMGLIGALLLPVFSPPITIVASILFSTPFLIGFTRDWLYVSGVLAPPPASKAAELPWKVIAPLVLRGTLWLLLAWAAVSQWLSGRPQPVILGLLIVGLAAIGAGAAGRIASLGMAILSGFVLRANPGAILYWAILLCGIGLFLAGTGRYSLWKPEDWLIYHRAGEAQRPS